MQVSLKKLPKSQVEISVVVPWIEWSKEWNSASEEVAKHIKVEGFRKGKIPPSILEKHVGRETILFEAAEQAIKKSYPKVLDQEKLDVVSRPEIQLDHLKEGDDLKYVAVVSIVPELSMNKDWRKVAQKTNKEYLSMKDIEVAEEDITKELERLADMRAKFVTVNRPARIGDNVEIDFMVLQDGVMIENGKSEKHHMALGSGVFIPGFEDAIVGMREGEEKTFELNFPNEYHAKHLAGKPASFQVKLRLTQEKEIPVLDDEFAKSMGNFENLMKLRESIAIGITKEKKIKIKEEHRMKLVEAVVEGAHADFPEIMIDAEKKRMLGEFRSQVETMGMQWDEYLKHIKKDEETVINDWKEQAEKRLIAEMVLEQLAKDEEVKIESEEIETEMNHMLQYFKSADDAKREANMTRLYSVARHRLQTEKVMEILEGA